MKEEGDHEPVRPSETRGAGSVFPSPWKGGADGQWSVSVFCLPCVGGAARRLGGGGLRPGFGVYSFVYRAVLGAIRRHDDRVERAVICAGVGIHHIK